MPNRRDPIEIPLELAEILDDWLPLRRQGEQRRTRHLRYGEKYSADGWTRIPDEAEQAVIADMLRWRGEGWAYQRIADELTRRGVPTKYQREKWCAASVYVTLKYKLQDTNGDRRPSIGTLPYGEKYSADGWTRIPDEAEQAVIADMLRWRGEGWAYQRIADELTRRGVPTKKLGGTWSTASINGILKRKGQSESDKVAAASDDHGLETITLESDPDLIFPSILRNGHRSRHYSYSAFRQLRRAGKALGIDGLNFESLMRFHSEQTTPAPPTRPVVSLWDDKTSARPGPSTPSAAGPTSAPRDSATGEDKSIDRKTRSCPVELRGRGVPIRVYGVEIPRMTGIAYDLTAFAVERYLEGDVCEGYELAGRTSTTCSNPIKSLKLKLSEPGFEPLARVLIWDGTRGGSLRIIDPGPFL